MADQVLVLNATYEPINVCSLKRAVVLVLKEKAEVLERAAKYLRSATSSFAAPLVIRLTYFVRVPRYQGRRISRRAVFARDGYECQYCGSRTRLTVDHVVPSSRGGAGTWDNLVTACSSCNLRKADRLPTEAAMPIRSTPRAPGPQVFISLAVPKRPSSWEPYLSEGI
ncbi:MAG: HNH endonuclease [Thermoleophilia bacterium]|nr:HNH endonuclease [Thermoleophilia bacterium]MDH3724440.1 HNH endonuclease [Thermoleophilia bacterium]